MSFNTGGGFGTNATPTTGAGGFGSFGGNTSAAPAAGFGFGGGLGTNTSSVSGNPSTGAATAPGFGGFGAGFGSATPNQGLAGGSNFGGGFSNSTTGTTNFGGGSAGGFGAQAAPLTGAASATNIQQRLQALAATIDPTTPSTNIFKYPFFNRLQNPSDMKRVQQPNYIDPFVQRQAQIFNPDPENMVAVWGIGFHDLKRRADEQDKMTEEHLKRLEAAHSFIQELQGKLQAAQQKIGVIRDKLAQQAHRHLHMAATVEVLRGRGIPIQAEEDSWRVRLQTLYTELQKPNEFRGRLNEIQSKARILSDGRAPVQLAAMLSAASNTLSEADLSSIATFLDEQRRGIAQLTNLLKADHANIETLLRLLNDPSATSS